MLPDHADLCFNIIFLKQSLFLYPGQLTLNVGWSTDRQLTRRYLIVYASKKGAKMRSLLLRILP
jgi:hypothetical protein